MNIDFIKWMCEKADGFELIEYDEFDIEITPPNISDDEDYFTDIGTFISHYAYPLLLQRAIEGVNRESCNRDDDYTYINIQQDCINYSPGVSDKWKRGYDGSINIFYTNMTEDQAKESALKYIYEQEMK